MASSTGRRFSRRFPSDLVTNSPATNNKNRTLIKYFYYSNWRQLFNFTASKKSFINEKQNKFDKTFSRRKYENTTFTQGSSVVFKFNKWCWLLLLFWLELGIAIAPNVPAIIVKSTIWGEFQQKLRHLEILNKCQDYSFHTGR